MALEGYPEATTQMADPARRRRVKALAIVGILGLLTVSTSALSALALYLAAYLGFGVVYGMCLQYGKFCFSSAFRDLFAVGVPRMAVGIMIAMVPFGVVSALLAATGMATFHPAPYGAHAVVAGLIFGAGMVLAGGCASGSLYKVGEGSGVAMLTVAALCVTQAIVVDVGGWLTRLTPQAWRDSAASRTLPASIDVSDGWMDHYLAGYVWDRPSATWGDLLGSASPVVDIVLGNLLLGIVVPAGLLLAWVYIVWVRRPYLARLGRHGEVPPRGWSEVAGYWSMITASRRTAIAGLLLGLAAGLHVIVMKEIRAGLGIENFGALLARSGITSGLSATGTVFDPGYWYVTTQEAQWAAWALERLGWDMTDNVFFGLANGIPHPLLNPPGWMSIGVMVGALVMALRHNEFRWKAPTMETAAWAILGGALMGIGARLGLGCNIGAFFVRVSQGDVSGWLFGLGMIGGAWGGVKILGWWTGRRIAREPAFALAGQGRP